MINLNIGAFTIGKIKSYRGHEGETCLQGSLLKDGKVIGDWSEDSWGGPMQFNFKTKEMESSFFEAANQHPIATEFVKEMKAKHGLALKEDACHADIVVSTIAQEIDLQHRQEAQIKRWCKTKIVLFVPSGTDGEYRTIKMAYDPKLDAELAKRYPGWEIVNKRYL